MAKINTAAYDFGGYATRNDLLCSDGRTIRRDAFKANDGQTVPLVWNHDHGNLNAVLGHALLENRDDGVYAYCKLNDSEAANAARTRIENGDLRALSIYANQLKHIGRDVVHGAIRELSLVMAGANPGAFIDWIMAHGDEEDDAVCACYDENAIVLYHSSTSVTNEEPKEDTNMAENEKKPETDGEETVAQVFNSLTDKQKTVVYAMIGQAIEDATNSNDDEDDDSEGGNDMKHNVFDNDTQQTATTLSHADQMAIVAMAKQPGVGSLRAAIAMYKEDAALAHGIDEIDTLFPDLKNLNPGAPELLRQDQGWVMKVINKIHKSPFSRIKTRQADARIAELRAHGYNDRTKAKTLSANIKLLSRETTPQTVYRRDELHRDDIVDIVDFDVVAYQQRIMKDNMYEELALAALVGDGREDGDPDKIQETHIRNIWNDEELYTIHKDVDIAAAKAELQGTNTSANFGDNYIYAEAIITAALYAREKFKGSGTPDLFCAPHLVNIMLLARDLNGRRIYDSKSDLAKALNVNEIHEIEQLEDRIRTTAEGDKKKLLGLFVNLADYTFGATKGGELTNFDDFDIDFNKYKYLMEARLCGTLTRPYAAIALEEPVTESAAG